MQGGYTIYDVSRRVKDPQVAISKGAPKVKKSRACRKCYGISHTIHTYQKVGNSKSAKEKFKEEFDLNEAYITSPLCTQPISPKDIYHDYVDKV